MGFNSGFKELTIILAAQFEVRFRISSCEIYVGLDGTWSGFSKYVGFSLSFSFRQCFTLVFFLILL